MAQPCMREMHVTRYLKISAAIQVSNNSIKQCGICIRPDKCVYLRYGSGSGGLEHAAVLEFGYFSKFTARFLRHISATS